MNGPIPLLPADRKNFAFDNPLSNTNKHTISYNYSRATVSTDSVSAVYSGAKKNWKIKEINGS
jgi:hypothetical protein